MADERYSGQPVTSTNRRIKRIKKQRVCLEEDCDTILSTYNTGKWCAAHANPRDDKFPTEQTEAKRKEFRSPRVRGRKV